MRQLEGFPESTRNGSHWRAYLGNSALLSPEAADAAGVEARWLSGLTDPTLKACRRVTEFREEPGDNYWMSWWARSATDDFDDSLANSRRFGWIRKGIPNILALVEQVEVATQAPVADFVINNIPVDGSLGSHRDNESGIVVAVDLMGSGRVTIDDQGQRSWFYTKPGEGFALQNLRWTSQRPAHQVRAINGPRVSIAI